MQVRIAMLLRTLAVVLAADVVSAEPACPFPGFVFDAAAGDEFDGARLDETRWDDWVWSFQGRRQGFMFARDNVAVTNGCLELTARPLREDERTVENLRRGFDKYATAIVKAKRKTRYGYYECRAKTMRACVCNAFWLYDPLSDSPAKFRPGDFSEEIDIFEIFGAIGRDESRSKSCRRVCFQTVHCLETPYLEAVVGNPCREKLPNKTSSYRADFDFWADYHVFGFLWTERELVWYVDGKETFRRDNDRFRRPLHLVFDCEVMFGWAGEPLSSDLPAVYSVDYFRYWRSPDELAAGF